MSRSHLRKQIIALLQKRDFASLAVLAGREPQVPGILMQFLYDPRDLLHWRAIEALGEVAAAHPGQVQKLINRLLWLLNEDSGSFGWGAPSALGEIGRRSLALIREIIPLFVGFLDEEFSRRPALWGLGRLGEVHPETMGELGPEIVQYLTNADPETRALAAWALGKMAWGEAVGELRLLADDAGPVEIYQEGELTATTVGQVAQKALAVLETTREKN